MSTGKKNKKKFVNVFSNEGRERMTLRLPGRSPCECQASKHRLIGNCLHCGRIVCEQEGSGPCFFCNTLVCTRSERELIFSETPEGKELEERLLTRCFRESDTKKFVQSNEPKVLMSLSEIAEAVAFKDKLIEFDRTSAQRTRVIDDASDYFDSNDKWLTKDQRKKLEKLQSQLDAKKTTTNQKINIDFAGRRIYSDQQTIDDKIVDAARQVHEENDRDEGNQSVHLNLSETIEAPKWVEGKKEKNFISQVTIEDKDRQRLRIQDRELLQMTDDGMCLSMHQPWASLLVRGIKMHEGRSWYTPHRGRLWIHAAAKEPDSSLISEMEEFYRHRNPDQTEFDFPEEYPTSVLLGCVDVIDCLDRETYLEQFPDGESESQYVLICENPQELFFKVPMKGQHKIYKIDNQTHQTAKKVLLRRVL